MNIVIVICVRLRIYKVVGVLGKILKEYYIVVSHIRSSWFIVFDFKVVWRKSYSIIYHTYLCRVMGDLFWQKFHKIENMKMMNVSLEVPFISFKRYILWFLKLILTLWIIISPSFGESFWTLLNWVLSFMF